MVYFCNGDGRDSFEAWACAHCANQTEEGTCPIMDAHMIFRGDSKEIDVLLDFLIPDPGMEPTAPDGKVLCTMFRAKADGVAHHAWPEVKG